MTQAESPVNALEDMLASLAAAEGHLRVALSLHLTFGASLGAQRAALEQARMLLVGLDSRPLRPVDLGGEDDTDELLQQATQAGTGAGLEGPTGDSSRRRGRRRLTSGPGFGNDIYSEPPSNAGRVPMLADPPAGAGGAPVFGATGAAPVAAFPPPAFQAAPEPPAPTTAAPATPPPTPAPAAAKPAVTVDIPEDEDDLFSDHTGDDTGRVQRGGLPGAAAPEPATLSGGPRIAFSDEAEARGASASGGRPADAFVTFNDEGDDGEPLIQFEEGPTNTPDDGYVEPATLSGAPPASADADDEDEDEDGATAVVDAAAVARAQASRPAAPAPRPAMTAPRTAQDEDVSDEDTDQRPGAAPAVRGRQAPSAGVRTDAAAHLYEQARSVPRIMDGSAPKVAAAAIQLTPAGGDGKVKAQILSEEEEELEIGAAEDYDADYEYDEDGDGFSIAIEEYEDGEEEEEEEEEAPEAPAPAAAARPAEVDHGPRLTLDEIKDLIGRAKSAAERGDLEGGVALYSDVLDADPDSIEASIGRGRLYLDLGDFARAMSDFSVAEDLAPESPEPQVAIGDLYFARKEYRKAIDYFNAALEVSPNHAMAFCRRGISHYYRKDYNEALEDLNNAQRLDPDIPNIRTYVSMAKKKKK